jgi:hypothetical protein
MLFAAGDKKCVPDSWASLYEKAFQLIVSRGTPPLADEYQEVTS